MFEKRKTNQNEPSHEASSVPAPTPRKTVTESHASMIGESIKIKGEVSGAGDLIINGSIDGKVELASWLGSFWLV